MCATVAEKFATVLLSVLMLTAADAPADAGIRAEVGREAPQHLLEDRGERFRLFQPNMVCTNWSLASLERRELLDEPAALRLTDDSATGRAAFYTHHPIVCQPWTRYRLTMARKLLAADADPPYVQIQMLDGNRDGRAAVEEPLNVAPAADEWTTRTIDFATDGETHALFIYFWTTPRGTCDLILDRIYLEQVGEPRALEPPGVELADVAARSLAQPGGLRLALPAGADLIELRLELVWGAEPAGRQIQLQWLNGDDAPLAAELCRIEPVRGVRIEWDGVEVEWLRRHGDPADKASMRLDRFETAGHGEGRATARRKLAIPAGARGLSLGVPAAADAISIERLIVTARPK